MLSLRHGECPHCRSEGVYVSTRIVGALQGLRKPPRQARSKATVEAIIEAGARILAEVGWAAFTTNKVAETAGASVGSLYQYFPNKLSLIQAIRRRHLDDCLAALRRVDASGTHGQSLIAMWIDALIRTHSAHPRLHRILLDEAPNFEAFRDPNSVFETEYIQCYVRAVMTLRSDLQEAEAQLIAIVLSDALDGVVHNAARRGTLGSPELRQELIKLMTVYLMPSTGRASNSDVRNTAAHCR